MRINQFVAMASGLSRRASDKKIEAGEVRVNGQLAKIGELIRDSDIVELNNKQIFLPVRATTIILNKPIGYVCSRNGQGSLTIYDLLPEDFHSLKTVGRLDKDSSGLILLTNDGQLANQLTHPSYQKQKIYSVKLNRPLVLTDKIKIEKGVKLSDGPSSMQLRSQDTEYEWLVTIHEGRNRQIRRTFAKLGYTVTKLNRQSFGEYSLDNIAEGKYRIIQ